MVIRTNPNLTSKPAENSVSMSLMLYDAQAYETKLVWSCMLQKSGSCGSKANQIICNTLGWQAIPLYLEVKPIHQNDKASQCEGIVACQLPLQFEHFLLEV